MTTTRTPGSWRRPRPGPRTRSTTRSTTTVSTSPPARSASPASPSTSSDSSLRQYGEWIFFRYLSERFPEAQGELPVIVRKMLGASRQLARRTPGRLLDPRGEQELASRGTDLRRVYAQFGAANRTPARTYEEGSHLPEGRRRSGRGRFTPKRHDTRLAGREGRPPRHQDPAGHAQRPHEALAPAGRRSTCPTRSAASPRSSPSTTGGPADEQVRPRVEARQRHRPGSCFDARKVRRVDVTLSNASIRYRELLARSGGERALLLQRHPEGRQPAAALPHHCGALSRFNACRTTAGSVVVHIGGRLALRKLP